MFGFRLLKTRAASLAVTVLLASILQTGLVYAGPAGLYCEYNFKLEAMNDFGSLAKGTKLDGGANYTIGQSFQQEGGVTAYTAEGSLMFGSEADGIIVAAMRAVNVARTDRMLDYLGLEAVVAPGDFGGSIGGKSRFVPLVNLAFYGPSGTLQTSDAPDSADVFKRFRGRRILQLQAPNGYEILLADIKSVSGGCVYR